MSEEELRLIKRAKRGDPAAFAKIYDQHQSAIYRYIYYQVGDASTAEDLTSDVFVRLVERIDRFTYRGRPLLAWLYTIARNLVTDHHRRAGRSLPLYPDEQLTATTIDPEKSIEHTLTQEKLAAAIACLTEDQQQVIILKFIEGLDNETTAQTLKKSVGSVKSLQHRALAALQRILEKDREKLIL
jgi:RNA polymerase sigma-70 factor (ECF subfamily)